MVVGSLRISNSPYPSLSASWLLLSALGSFFCSHFSTASARISWMVCINSPRSSRSNAARRRPLCSRLCNRDENGFDGCMPLTVCRKLDGVRLFRLRIGSFASDDFDSVEAESTGDSRTGSPLVAGLGEPSTSGALRNWISLVDRDSLIDLRGMLPLPSLSSLIDFLHFAHTTIVEQTWQRLAEYPIHFQGIFFCS